MPSADPNDPANPFKWSSAFRSALATLTNAYIDIKDALVVDNIDNAVALVTRFSSLPNRVKLDEMNGAAQNYFKPKQEALIQHCIDLVNTKEPAVFRQHFSELSQTMAELLRTFGSSQEFYWHYCPDALEGKGAYWLAGEKEIFNPYGPGLENCGRTVEIYPAIDPNAQTF